jgi:presenilin-like A22 family membrane protease
MFIGFALALVLANLSSWAMQKSAVKNGYQGQRWKLWLGDVSLPKEVLTIGGLLWRRVSIVSFILLIVFGILIGVQNSNGSICFGLNS